MKQRIKRVPMAGPGLVRVRRYLSRHTFSGSRRYWEHHYARGGTSGEGSAGARARFKAEVLNDFVTRHGVGSVVEFGCGDGQQLALASYPRYLGLDVSPTVLRRTMDRFAGDPTKSFLCYDPARFTDPAGFLTADLALSLDVIYHLVEDDAYFLHLRQVFDTARRFVVLFTSDRQGLATVEQTAPHVRHRPVARDVGELFPQWRLRERIPNRYPYRGPETATSFADFFIYEPVTPGGAGEAASEHPDTNA
jgi:SAM-dependent methyltransferase